MADCSRKRSRKSKLVLRECVEGDEDNAVLQKKKLRTPEKIQTENKDVNRRKPAKIYTNFDEFEAMMNAENQEQHSAPREFSVTIAVEKVDENNGELLIDENSIKTEPVETNDDTTETPHETQEIPLEKQEIPHETQEIPHEIKEIPHETSEIPHTAVPDPKPTKTPDVTDNLKEKREYKLKRDEILKDTTKILEESNNVADKMLCIAVRHCMGHFQRYTQDPFDNKIHQVFRKWQESQKQLSASFKSTPLLYKCYVCERSWWHFYDFREHLRLHYKFTLRLEEFPLPEINIVAYLLVEQITTVKDFDTAGDCPKCGNDFSVHKLENRQFDGQYKCRIGQCQETFYTCFALKQHEFAFHTPFELNGVISSVVKWKKSCELCDFVFITQNSYQKHMVLMHSVRSDIPVPSYYRSCKYCKVKQLYNWIHDCPKRGVIGRCVCLKIFSLTTKYNTHLRENVDYNFNCSICHAAVPDRCFKIKHLMTHTDKFVSVKKCLLCVNFVVVLNKQEAMKHMLAEHERGDKMAVRRYFDNILVPKSCLARKELTLVSVQSIPEKLSTQETSKLPELPVCKPTNNVKPIVVKRHPDAISSSMSCSMNLEMKPVARIIIKNERIGNSINPITRTYQPKNTIFVRRLTSLPESCSATKLPPFVSAKPVLIKPVSAIPVSAMPVSAKPVSAMPVSAMPVSAKPVSARPVSARPVSAMPVSAMPVSAKPVSAMPVSAMPVSAKPVSARPVSAMPVSAMPVSAKPVSAMPMSAMPVPAMPESAKPVPAMPVSAKPVSAKPVSAKPVSASCSATKEGEPLPSCSIKPQSNPVFDIIIKEEPTDADEIPNLVIKEEIIDEFETSTPGSCERITFDDPEDQIHIKQEIDYEECDLGEQYSIKIEEAATDISTIYSTNQEEVIVKQEDSEYEDDIIRLDANYENSMQETQISMQETQISMQETQNYLQETSQGSEKGNLTRGNRRTKRPDVRIRIPKMYTCTKCGFTAFHRQFKEHSQKDCVRNVYDQGSFTCTKCNTEFNEFKKYILHFSTHGLTPMTCPACFKNFTNQSDIELHVSLHIRMRYATVRLITFWEETAKFKYRCKVCKADVKKCDFFAHWERHLTLVEDREDSEEESRTDTTKSIDDKLIRSLIETLVAPDQGPNLRGCVICQKYFTRKNDCKRHLIEHLLSDAYSDRPRYQALKCQICSKCFQRADGYKKHMRDHALLPEYKCEICNKNFSDSSNFTKHKKLHNSNAYICDICGRKFQAKFSIEKHMEIHETQKPIKCEPCNKVFYLETAFRKHLRVMHDKGGYKYSCRMCSQKFYSAREKWDHMWYIHRERKEKADCPLCDSSFRKFRDLQSHLKVSHNSDLKYYKNGRRRTKSDVEKIIKNKDLVDVEYAPETLVVFE